MTRRSVLSFLGLGAGPAQGVVRRQTVRRRAKPAPRRPTPEIEASVLARLRGQAMQNGEALGCFTERLRQLESAGGRLSILQFGDSHTAADEWTGALRRLMQERFGDGGSGFSHAGTPWRSFRRLDVRSGSSRGWRTGGLSWPPGDGLDGLGGVSVTAAQKGESVYLGANCQRIEVWFLRQPEGGSFSLEIDGAEAGIVHTSGERGNGFVSQNVRGGAHQFRVTTCDDRPVRLYGWVAENDSGVTAETLGINGAQAVSMLNWNEAAWSEQLARRTPALIVLAYGTNDASNAEWTPGSYRDMFAGLVHRVRKACPAAGILVAGPPDCAIRTRRGWQSRARLDLVESAQREVALGTGCTYWNLRAKMGGKGSIGEWVRLGLAQPDHVHFTAAGYRLFGTAMFQDLMDQYQAG